MHCETHDCCYWVLDECICKRTALVNGKCPHYMQKELDVLDVFKLPAVRNWEIRNNDKTYVMMGHVLDVVAAVYNNPYVVVRPTTNKVTTRIVNLPDEINVHMYLDFMDTNIYAMYLESLSYDYLEKSSYIIRKIDCSGNYLHVEGELK